MSVESRQQPTGIELLPLYCPFGAAINPHADAIERACIAWIDRFELYGSEAQRRRLIATKAAEAYSRALPTAEPQRVADVAKWLYWGFATDDLLYDNGPVSVSAAGFLAVGAPLVRIAAEPRARFDVEPPYTAALRDLVLAVRRHSTPGQALDWASTARAWFFGMAWDVANAERGVPPSLNDYLAMRMHTGGLASWITTLNIANGVELSAEQAASPAFRALSEAWSTFALLLNDLMSYPKEALNGDNSSNIVSVVAHEHGCDPQVAVPRAYALCDRLGTLFMGLRAQLLTDADDALRTCIAGMEHSWRGILDWGFASARYVTGGDPEAPPLLSFPGWATEPSDASLQPLPYASVSWWWEELARR
ncbi:MAG: hypothetical protein WD993_06610 [Thermoleophilaceae bacterium]